MAAVRRYAVKVLCLSLLLAPACGRTEPAPERPPAASELTSLADEYFKTFVETYPLGATFLGVPDAPNDRLGDNSLAGVKAWQEKEDRWLERLKRISPDLPVNLS